MWTERSDFMPETTKERDKRWLPVVAICLALIGAAMWVSTLLPTGQARTAETTETKSTWPQVLCVREGRLLRTTADGSIVLEEYDVELRTLPDDERERLAAGVTVNDEESLSAILENYMT
jgi:hypothetical protein